MSNRFGFPYLGFGMGLRTVHYNTITQEWPDMDWFEIISENYMDIGGRPKYILDQIRERYPVVMHGVSMSVGSPDPLDFDYLTRLKNLADQIGAPWVSDHVCWTGVHGINTHDLLPIPYTEDSLQNMVDNIKTVQEVLERPLILENPSTYLEFEGSDIDEWEWMATMAEESDCGLLLDINNVYVNCFNHGYDAKKYIDALPADRVVQIHLAGHTNKGTHIVDTHDDYVVDEVWELYRYAFERLGNVSVMVEWDDNIPPYSVVHEEVMKAKNHWEEVVAEIAEQTEESTILTD